MTESEKLNRLVRWHRQNVFDSNPAKAARHERALKRLKRTPTARRVYAGQAAHGNWRESERLLRLWA
jgi:hypothetical protein